MTCLAAFLVGLQLIMYVGELILTIIIIRNSTYVCSSAWQYIVSSMNGINVLTSSCE